MKTIGFIGAGNMAFALAGAVCKAGVAEEIVAADIRTERLDLFAAEFEQFRPARDAAEVAEAAEAVFLAVKPQDMDTVLDGITATETLVISIAAGITLGHLETALPSARVVRVMPNTPCLVGEMAAGYTLGQNVTPADARLVERLLRSAGSAVLLDEDLLDVVTGLSGSGPAFVARLIQAFAEGGIKQGLSPDIAQKLSIKTFLGTARLLQDQGMHPEELVDMVSSPKGTTVAGRAVLEASKYEQIIVETIAAATRRSKELGNDR